MKTVASQQMDTFAEGLDQFYRNGRADLYFQRDDGYKNEEDLSWYLTSYKAFPLFEKQVLRFAQGRVLDMGCGPGRHALYLQRRGFPVTGLDNSTLMVELARERGVKDVRTGDLCGRLPFGDGEFDTVLLLGNNLGICGTTVKFRRMLRELYRITSPQGRILGGTRMPNTRNPLDREYILRNLEEGRPAGQMQIRHILDGRPGNWFHLLFFTPTELMQLAAMEKWRLEGVFTEIDYEDGYSVVLEKKIE